MKRHPVISIIVALSLTVNGQTVVHTPLCSSEGQDAYLASGAASTNYGNHPSLGGNTWTCLGNHCLSRGLLQFPLSVPSTAIVTSAELLLFADLNWSPSPTTGGPNNLGTISRVTSPWQENSVTWNTQPAVTSVNAVTVPASTGTAQDYTVNVTGIVQDILSSGNNFGFMLNMQDEVNPYLSLMFASSDNLNNAKCPVLQVTYSFTTNGIAAADPQTARVHVAPNPFSAPLSVTSEGLISQIVITDCLGRVVVKEQVNASAYVLREPLCPGVYTIRVYDGADRLIHWQKIISER